MMVPSSCSASASVCACANVWLRATGAEAGAGAPTLPAPSSARRLRPAPASGRRAAAAPADAAAPAAGRGRVRGGVIEGGPAAAGGCRVRWVPPARQPVGGDESSGARTHLGRALLLPLSTPGPVGRPSSCAYDSPNGAGRWVAGLHPTARDNGFNGNANAATGPLRSGTRPTLRCRLFAQRAHWANAPRTAAQATTITA